MTQCWFHHSRPTWSKWRRKSIYICRWQVRNTWARPMKRADGFGGFERVICAPDENIKPRLALSRKCSARTRRRGNEETRRPFSAEPDPSSVASPLTNHMCWPGASACTQTILQCACPQLLETWTASGLSKCQRLRATCLHISEWCMVSPCAIYSLKQ